MKSFYSLIFCTLFLFFSFGTSITVFAVEPTTQATNMAVTAATSTSISLSWTRGNGANVLVLGRVTAVNAGPADGSTYTASSTFGSGSAITGFPSTPANYVVYIGTGTSVTVTGLAAGTTYEFYAFEFNGSGGTEDYLTTGSSNNVTQIVSPSTQASSITFATVTTTSMTINWTSGNGSNRIVAVKEGVQGTITNPSFGTKYATSTDWSAKGDQLGTSGYYIVYDGNGTTVSLTNLAVSTTYWVQIFEYNEPDTAYITSTATNNPNSQATLKNAPSTQATNITFSSVAATTMTVSWTRGDGDYCLVVAEASSNANTPSDGTDYTANAAFGSGDAIVATGTSYVVYEGTGTTVDITNLTAGTTYYYKVYEFNNIGTNTKYLVTDGTNNPNSQATLSSSPSTQASLITFSSVSTTSMTINWTSGDGDSVIVAVRETDQGTITNPSDNITYTANADWSVKGDQLGTSGYYIVYNGSSSTVSLTNLTAGTTYWVQIFEYNNGAGSEVYLTTTATDNPNSQATIKDAPTTQASQVTFSNIQATTMTAGWTRGNGENVLVLAKSGSTVDASPSNGATYTANAAFGSGDQIGTGNYVIYNGSGTSVDITALTASTTYYIKVFEYNNTGTDTKYIITDGTNNPNSQITLEAEPTTQASSIVFSSIQETQMTLTWTNGNGGNRIVLAHLGSAVDSDPVDANAYTANSVFSSGDQIGTGNYVVYNGSGTTVTVTGLVGATTYYYKVYEYNSGTGGTNYYIADATNNPNSQATTAGSAPATQASSINFTSVTTTAITINWTNGDGSARIVAVRETDQGTITNPSDNTTYSASSDWSAKGTQLGTSGYYIVYNGSSNSVTLSNLSDNTDYWVQIFEYNNAPGSEAYNTGTATGNPNNQTTLKLEPTNDVTGFASGTVSNNSIQLNWTDASAGVLPDGYLIKASTTSLVAIADPVDGTAEADDTDLSDGAGVKNITQGTQTYTFGSLNFSTPYFFKIYSYTNSGTDINYKNTTAQTVTDTTIPNDPGSFTATASSSSQIDLTFTTNGSDNVIIVWDADGTFTTPSGTPPAVGNPFAGGTVLYNGTASPVNHTSLTANTQYFYKAWSVNTNNEYSANGLTDNATTAKTEPSEHVTNFDTVSISYNSITLDWTASAGSVLPDGYLIVAKKGAGTYAAVADGTPVADDSDWTDNNAAQNVTFGTNTVTFSGLNMDVSYDFKIYPYTNSGSNIDFKTDVTIPEKTGVITNPGSAVWSALTPDDPAGVHEIDLGWSQNSNSDSVIIARNTSNSFTAPANDSQYTVGSSMGGTETVIYKDNAATTYTDNDGGSGLTANQMYFYRIWSLNNNKYSTGSTSNVTTYKDAPTTQSSAIAFSNIASTSLTISWTRGDGDSCIVAVRETDQGTITNPSDNTAYTANSDWSSKGDQLGTSGYYIVYNGSSNSVTVTNLINNTVYWVQIFEYNNTSTYSLYFTGSGTNNPKSQQTPCTPPTIALQATPITSIAPTSATFNANISAVGGGTNIAKRGFEYSVNSDLSSASDLSETGTYIIGDYSLTASTVLNAETQYYYRAYSINDCSVTETAYSHTSGFPSFFTYSLEPSAHSTTFTASKNSLTQIDLAFDAASTITNADGYIILQKAGATAPASNPTDGTGYSVSDVIGDGTVVAIITNTASTSTTISSLTQGTQYSFKIIPFNWNATNNETYNYYTGGTIPSATQTTYYQSNTFTGNGNWNSSSNWSNGEVPYSGADATISDTVTVTANASINNLTLSVGSNVTVNDGITLSVGGNMTISADATGTASYVENGTGTVSVTGTMTAQCYVGGFNYHYISSPVTNETVGNVLTGYYVKMYNESNAAWDYGSTSTVMTPGKGFNVRYSSGNHTLSFTGTLNTGSVSISTTADNTDGWNLVGNPYPSAIDWDASSGWTKTNVSNGIYFYDGTQYATYVNGSGTNGGTRYIPPSQGFFVSTTSAGTLGMTNAVRVHDTQAFWKNGTNSKLNNVLKLQVSGNSYTDDIVIRFIDGATTNFDNDYDAYKWSSGVDSIPELFTKDNANNDLSVNTQPLLTDSWSTAVGFNIGKAGTYTISATEYNNFSNSTAIYLEDLFTGELINLKAKSYTFTSDIVNDTNRFVVHFYPSSDTWTGNSTDWNNTSNWESGTIPSTGNIAIIPGSPAGGKQPVINSNNTCNELVLLPGANLTINSGYTLTVNGDLIIKANASFIDEGTLNVLGNTIVEKQIEKNRWWYLTPSISNATSNIFDAVNTDHLLYYWNETNSGTHGWNQISNNNTNLFGSSLPLMKGYAAKFLNSNATIKFNGPLITGNQTINLTRTTGVEKEGFNLIGNPYPSAINWDTASVTKTNIDNVLWYRTNGTFADYNGNSGIGTNGGQKYIPAMQAFWVRVSDGQSNGSLSLTNDARLHASQAFYKSNNNNKKLIRLSVGNNISTDETVIAFIDNAQTSFDAFDTEKMLPANVDDIPLIYSQPLAGSNNLSVNSLPFTSDIITIPLLVNMQNTTSSIFVKEILNFNTNEGVFLEDLLTGDMVNLKQENNYEFSGGVSVNNKRFLIHFTTLTTSANTGKLNFLNIYSSDNHIFIQNNNKATNVNIKVYDLLGKIIINEKVLLTGTRRLSLNKTGVYIIKVIAGNNIYRKEVFINEK